MSLNAEVGSPDANSYVTVAEADTYFETRIYAGWWNDLVNKEQFLVTASQQLDSNLTWKGSPTNDDQAMGWPRTGVLYPSGADYPDDIIPIEVKKAVYEYALASKEVDRSADRDLDGLAEVRAGSLLVKTDTSLYAKQFKTVPDSIRRLVADFTRSSGIGVVRLMRA